MTILKNITRDTVENSVQRGLQFTIEADDDIAYLQLKDFYIYVDSDDQQMTPSFIEHGFWEPWNTVWFGRNVKDDMTVVDVGANVGYFTMMAARLVGKNGEVIAIEPNPSPMRLLKKSAVENEFDNIRFYECAVSDKPGLLELNVPDINIGGATLQSVDRLLATSDKIGSVNSFSVSVHTLDDLLLGTVDKIDIIKMDVEGLEPYVWNGMQKILKQYRPAIILEYSPDRLSNEEQASFIESMRYYGKIHIVTDIGTEVKVDNTYLNRINWIATLVVRPFDYGE